jgi:hypothetical protein
MNTSTAPEKMNRPSSGLIAGGMLILIGLLTLLVNTARLDGRIILPGLGALFLAWGLLTRTTGLIIPGGILSSLGAGIYLVSGPYEGLHDLDKAGLILLSMAGGWALISLLSLYTNRDGSWSWWPLIPGAALAFFGTAFIYGGQALDLLRLIGIGWPVILIAIGAYLILRRKDLQN